MPGYIAREDLTAALDAALWGTSTGATGQTGKAALRNTNSGAAAGTLTGLGGVGKSTLAQQYAWDNRARYEGVWWIRAEDRQTLLDDLIDLGSRFVPGLKEEQDRDAAARKALETIANLRGAKPWLLVYDNAENADVMDWTPSTGAHVLVTSRAPEWYGHATSVDVGVYPRAVSVAYLLARARGSDRDPDRTATEADALANDLGDLPLALAIARAHAWGMNWTLGVYRGELEAELATLLDRDPAKAKGTNAYERSLTATFDLAIRKALDTAPQAERLLGIAAFLAPDRIPLDIVTTDVMPALELGEAVAALSDVSLVTPETLPDGTAAISVHRLVQAVMRRRLGDGAAAIAALATRLVAEAFPGGNEPSDVRNWPACARLATHATAMLDHAPDSGDGFDKTSLLANQLALYLAGRADFANAEPLYRRALAIDEASCGQDHPSVATRLNNLGQLLSTTHRLDEAELLMRRALAIDEASFGAAHPDVAIDLNNLAQLLMDTNRHDEAEPLMRRVVSIFETALGEVHPNVAIGLNNLAGLLRNTNRSAEAEPLYRRALEVDEASFGPNHPDVARDVNNLATLLHATNRLAEAEPLMRRVLSIFETAFGKYHPNVATALSNLAMLLNDTNRPTEAEPLIRRALAIDEATHSESHPKVAVRLNNLALLLQATNRFDEAEPLMRRALVIDELGYGPNHPNVACDLNNLATLLQDTNRPAEAEPLMRRALVIDEASYGPNHPDVARDLNNLAQLLQATNRLAEAEPLMRRMVAIFELFNRATGHEHPSYRQALANLAHLEAAIAAQREAPAEPPAADVAADTPPASPPPPAPPPAPRPWAARIVDRLLGRG